MYFFWQNLFKKVEINFSWHLNDHPRYNFYGWNNDWWDSNSNSPIFDLYFWTRSREWPIHGPMSFFMKMSSFEIDFQSYILNHFSVRNFVSTLFCWPSTQLVTLVIHPMYRTWWFGFNLVAIDEILNDKALIVLVGCVPWISFFSRSSRSEVEKSENVKGQGWTGTARLG